MTFCSSHAANLIKLKNWSNHGNTTKMALDDNRLMSDDCNDDKMLLEV